MRTKQITVMAFPTAMPGKEEEMLTRLQALCAATRQEAGCIDFHVHHQARIANRFSVDENFADQAAFDAHLAAPHTRQFMAFVEQSGATLQYEFWAMASERPGTPAAAGAV